MKNNGFTLIELMIVVAILGILTALFVPVISPVSLFPHYSSGERTGVVVKLSKKGIVWKTWEGEMNIGSMSADGNGVAVPTLFEFSVKDDGLAEKIEAAQQAGKRTTLIYEQALLRARRDGETPYQIVGIK